MAGDMAPLPPKPHTPQVLLLGTGPKASPSSRCQQTARHGLDVCLASLHQFVSLWTLCSRCVLLCTFYVWEKWRFLTKVTRMQSGRVGFEPRQSGTNRTDSHYVIFIEIRHTRSDGRFCLVCFWLKSYTMQDWAMVLVFLFILMKKDNDNWWYYNGLFSGFWKIPWISVQGDTHDMCCLHSICPVLYGRGTFYIGPHCITRGSQPGVTSFPRGHLATPGVIFGCHNLCDELLLASSVYRLRMLLKIRPYKTAPFNKRLIQPPVLIVLRLRSLC